MTASEQALYIYFRSDERDSAAVLEAMERHRSALRSDGVDVRFSRRSEIEKGLITWMEVYRVDEGTSAEAIRNEIERKALDSGLLRLARDGRHVELFIPVLA